MSFQQGLSGLSAASKNLEVIGNNVANANTYGEKASRAEFADMYAAAMTGNNGSTTQAGIGVTVAAVTQQFTQGNITTTSNPLDLAINGNGFFQVQGQGAQTLYTRNGQFHADVNGQIVNDQSQKLMGYAADAQGNILQGNQLVPLTLPTGIVPPKATDSVTMEFNLDARSSTIPPATPPIDFNNQATYNNATSVTMYDKKGQNVAVSFYFQKTGVDAAGNDTWDVYATQNGTTIGGTAASPAPVGTLTFDANNGQMMPPTNIALNLGTAFPGAVNIDMSTATEYGSAFGVTNLTATGYAAGQLTGVSVDTTGKLMAQYSNGQQKATGQLVLANFANPQGLEPLGGNAWAQTNASGVPHNNFAGQGNTGTVSAGALEESNIDLTAELVNMMTAQRDYQANAQTIKTEDQTMQTLVNLK
jgi:flagellar hook protein FlgE